MMSARRFKGSVLEKESGNCLHRGNELRQDPCPQCALEFARDNVSEADLQGEVTVVELKRELPHLKRLLLISRTSYRATFRARHIETGKSVILRVFRHACLKSEDLFRFSKLIEDSQCEVLTETLEIGEIGSFYYEILHKPAGNTLYELVKGGQLEIDELWRVAGMVNQHSFRLQSLGLPFPPPADCVYLANDGAISALIGPSDLIDKTSDATRAFQIGDIVGKKYRLLSCVGAGGSADVFEAEQLYPIARQVALKISRSGGVGSEAYRQFEIERSNLMKLDHPNIARILDAGFAAEGKPFLAVELIRNAIPFTEYCSTNDISLRQRLRMFACVCEAIDYAHRTGIIHRDLKPSNIMVARRPTINSSLPVIKVLDFGISASTAGAVETQTWDQEKTAGTPQYMAPEQNSGLGDTRTDVFALGRILSELIEQSPTADIGTSKLELIALKAQQQKPHNRHASPADLAACINKFLDHQSGSQRQTLRSSVAAKLRSQLRNITQSFKEPKKHSK